MRIVITGAAGFLGLKLAKALGERGHLVGPDGTESAITDLVLFDRSPAPVPPTERVSVKMITGDLADAQTVAGLIQGPIGSIFHLAAVVSAAAEEDFDLGMQVNLHGTRWLLEACRRLPTPPRLIFTSSVAVFGGTLPEVIHDETAPTPQSSYGAQKAIGELLVNDYSRKGFIDGRSLRLPTIVIRPGKPNRAASAFASSILREPLQGAEAVCPVPAETAMWILSPRRVIDALIHAHNLPAQRWGTHRTVNLPGLSIRVGEMVEAMRELAGGDTVKRIQWERNELIERIVGSWPARFDPRRGLQLGFTADSDMQDIIRGFIKDDLSPASA